MRFKLPSSTIFVVGIFSGFVLLICYFFFLSLFSTKTQQETRTQTSILDSTNASSDPLVTVVPKGLSGTTPKALATDPARGASTPNVLIIEFGDFQCEDCVVMEDIFDQVIKTYRTQIALVWKDFPIPALHPQSNDAAIAARCAQAQGKFWEYHDLLFLRQDRFAQNAWTEWARELGLDTNAFSICLTDPQMQRRVVEGYYVGRALEIDTTPTYYINDRVLVGIHSKEEITQIIEEEITTKGKI